MFFTDLPDNRFKVKDPPKKIKTLIERGKDLEKKELTLLEEFDRRLRTPEKTLLEIGLTIGDKKEPDKKKKRRKIIEERIEVPIGERSDEDPHERLLHYAKKYLINPVGANGKKTYKEIADEVFKYELKNRNRLIKEGVDKKYLDYGFYLKLV